MKLEEKVERLKSDIELMKRFYYKGFGCLVSGIDAYFNIAATYNTTDEEIEEEISKTSEDIERFYDLIPFEELDSNPDFSPIIAVRGLLESYLADIKKALDRPDKKLAGRISERTKEICEYGKIYDANFKRKISELREIHGYENFKVEVIDHKGDVFIL